MTTATVLRQVKSHLEERGVRLTKGRRRVIETLATSDGPRSASELNEVLGPQVPLSSLYRSLAVLEEAGVLVPHLGAKGLTRFELAEWLTGHHHHLVCVECGAVSDIEIGATEESKVRRLVTEIAAVARFQPFDHALEIEGRCARCA